MGRTTVGSCRGRISNTAHGSDRHVTVVVPRCLAKDPGIACRDAGVREVDECNGCFSQENLLEGCSGESANAGANATAVGEQRSRSPRVGSGAVEPETMNVIRSVALHFESSRKEMAQSGR